MRARLPPCENRTLLLCRLAPPLLLSEIWPLYNKHMDRRGSGSGRQLADATVESAPGHERAEVLQPVPICSLLPRVTEEDEHPNPAARTHARTCPRTHARAHAHVHTQTHVHTHMHTDTCTRTQTRTCTDMRTDTHVQTHAHTCTRADTRAQTCTDLRTQRQACTHTHTFADTGHTCTPTHARRFMLSDARAWTHMQRHAHRHTHAHTHTQPRLGRLRQEAAGSGHGDPGPSLPPPSCVRRQRTVRTGHRPAQKSGEARAVPGL